MEEDFKFESGLISTGVKLFDDDVEEEVMIKEEIELWFGDEEDEVANEENGDEAKDLTVPIGRCKLEVLFLHKKYKNNRLVKWNFSKLITR